MSRRANMDVSEYSAYPTGNRKTIPREERKNQRTASVMIAGVLGDVLTGQLSVTIELTCSLNTLD
jgi:hypothetical protein